MAKSKSAKKREKKPGWLERAIVSMAQCILRDKVENWRSSRSTAKIK